VTCNNGIALAKNISAEGAKQQSQGREPREKRGGETNPERAAQVFALFNNLCPPCRAAAQSIPNPGFRPLRRLHPGLCCFALSALFPRAADINSIVTGDELLILPKSGIGNHWRT
jgi:hypothetical protein